MQHDARALRSVLGNFATGVAIVSAVTEDGCTAGLTVNSFTSVSLDPKLVMFSLRNDAWSRPLFERATAIGISFLAAEQEPLSRHFSTACEDRWKDVPSITGPNGSLLVDGALAQLDCVLEKSVEAGDHCLIICRLLNFQAKGNGAPLLFFRGSYGYLPTSSVSSIPDPITFGHIA